MRLATQIGNRAMQRIAIGEIPAGLSMGVRALQRDTPRDAKRDPRAGMWVKFQGSRSSHGEPRAQPTIDLRDTSGSSPASSTF
jgi:hypothetical protein